MRPSVVDARARSGKAAPMAFWLLGVINLFVGGMVGLERTVLPLMGRESFGLAAGASLGAFVIGFSLSKAVANLLAGALADRIGRRRVLIVGWLLALPLPLLLMLAPSWSWVVAGNLLLGVNQALTWSMTVNMMVDLMPPRRRGLAAGINEFAGYLGVSALAYLTGIIAANYGLRPAPFVLGLGVAIAGLALSLATPETRPPGRSAPLGWVPGVGLPSALGSATNLKDGLVWLALPLLLADRGLTLAQIGAVAGLYPLVWAAGQLLFGPLSDRLGRTPLITGGMLLQGAGLLLLADAGSLVPALSAAALLGVGTGMVYPTLIAQVADLAPSAQRATALGIYRFFRDGGYALGAVLAGLNLGGPSGGPSGGLSGSIRIAALLLLALGVWSGITAWRRTAQRR